MKFLSHYTEKGTSAALEKYGAFFAFSNEQFDRSKVENIKYVNAGRGLIVPENNLDDLINELDKVYEEAVKEDIAENGIDNIIKRELANYECYYTGRIADAVDALVDYNVSEDEIRKIFISNRDSYDD